MSFDLGRTTPPTPLLPPPAPYEDTISVEKIPGKDLGVRAKRPIRRGEIFFCEKPLLRVTHSPGPANHQHLHEIKYCADKDEGYAKWKLMTLAKNAGSSKVFTPKHGNRASKDLASVLNTNAFVGEDTGQGTRHSLTFLTVSRINHSCAPNAELSVSLQPSELGLLRALRDVARGEEVSARDRPLTRLR